MARGQETATARVLLDGQQAGKELEDLKKKALQLRKELNKKMEIGDAEGVKSLKKQLGDTDAQILKMRKSAWDLNGVLKNLSGSSLRDLEKAQRDLTNQVRHSSRATEEERKALKLKSEQLKSVKSQIQQLKTETNLAASSNKSFFASLGDGFNRYFGLATAGFAAIAGFVLSVKNVLTSNSQLSDSMSDVAKSTGMSMAEVKELNKELRKIDTRTSRKELLDLAYVAGKLGYSSQYEVLGFVRAADQIGVALSKDLGGNVEDAVNSLGKLTDIFKLKDEFGIEQALLKTGSAINSLGAASTANEAYIVDFTRRLGGIAPQAGFSIEQVLGMAATLDQLGQTSETASTAVTQLITKMFKDPATFARIAGVETKKFADLINNDANGALILFLQGLQKNNGGLAELAANFADLGVDGTRSIGVIGALANNIDILNKTQALSNKEFEAGISLTNEFNIKNDNMASNLEKVSRGLEAAFVNSDIMDGLNFIVAKMAEWFKIPLSEKMADESIKVNQLASELTDYNISSERRNQLYKTLQQIAPGVLAGINSEAISVETLTNNLAKYNEEMINRIVVQQEQEKIDEVAEDAANARAERIKAESALRRELMSLQQRIFAIDKKAGIDMSKILNDQTKSFSEKVTAASLFVQSFNKNQKSVDGVVKTVTINKDFTPLFNIYLGLLNEEKLLIGETNELSRQKSELSKQLGLNTEILNSQTKKLSATEESNSDEIDKVTGSYTKLSEKIGELETKIKDFKAAGKNVPTEILSEYNKLKSEKDNIDKATNNNTKQAISDYQKLKNSISDTKDEIVELVYEGKLERAMELQKTVDYLERVLQYVNEIVAAGGDLTKVVSRTPITAMNPITTITGNTTNAGTMQPRNKYSSQFGQQDSNQDESNKWSTSDRMNFAIDSAQTIADAEFNIIQQKNQREYDAYIDNLERQREAELSNKNLTEAQKDAINRKYEAKELAAKRQAAKKQYQADLAQAWVNMALSIGKAAINTWPVPAIPMMAAAGIAGGAQIATIMSNKPSFYSGGDTGPGLGIQDSRGTVAGIVHANEYVIPEWMRGMPQVIAFERIMEGIRTGRQLADGGAVAPARPGIVVNSPAPQVITQSDPALLAAIDKLNSRLDGGIKTNFSIFDFDKFQKKVDDIESISSF